MLYIVPASIALAASFLLYVVLFVGRRGKNLPPGRDQILTRIAWTLELTVET
jgi:hypothetical protein